MVLRKEESMRNKQRLLTEGPETFQGLEASPRVRISVWAPRHREMNKNGPYSTSNSLRPCWLGLKMAGSGPLAFECMFPFADRLAVPIQEESLDQM